MKSGSLAEPFLEEVGQSKTLPVTPKGAAPANGPWQLFAVVLGVHLYGGCQLLQVA